MCSSDFVFWKNKQDSAFCVSGVLQLPISGPPLTKNFPLLRLFLSDAMMAWRFYTPYDVNSNNLHILTARGMSHILTRIDRTTRININQININPNDYYNPVIDYYNPVIDYYNPVIDYYNPLPRFEPCLNQLGLILI